MGEAMPFITAKKLQSLTPFSQQEIGKTRPGGVGFAPAMGATKSDSPFSGGSWGYGPLEIHWQFKNDDEIDVDLSLLGIKIADLSGTLTKNDAEIMGEAGVLDVVKLRISLKAEWTGPDAGLTAEGELVAFGLDKKFKQKLISW
jgi:hypothetical protein